jgi:hypothetical protein
MPYFTCPRCRLNYYSAASWAYAPECPSCHERLNHPAQGSDRVLLISRREERDQRDPGRGDGRT